MIAAVPSKATGAANRRSPVGACANGIPRYSETEEAEALRAACPITDPELVCTVCPTVQFEADCLVTIPAAANGARREMAKLFILRETDYGTTNKRRKKAKE